MQPAAAAVAVMALAAVALTNDYYLMCDDELVATCYHSGRSEARLVHNLGNALIARWQHTELSGSFRFK